MKHSYTANSNLAARVNSSKLDHSFRQTWSKYVLWTAIACSIGLLVARNLDTFSGVSGLDVLALAVLIATMVWFFCYRTDSRNEERFAEPDHHIAEQQQISNLPEGSEATFRNAFEQAAGIALVAPDGRWLKVNRSLCETLGYTESELLGDSFQNVAHPDELGTILVHIHKLLNGSIPTYQVEQRYIHKLGHAVWMLVSVSLVRNGLGKPSHFIFQVQEITDRKRAEESLVHDVFHDALTGLPNRGLFMNRLELAIERARRRKDQLFAVLFLDLDHFKGVNDSLGHMFGDQLLIEIARRLKRSLRSTDTIARLGGDEFTILLEDLSDHDETMRVVERLQKDLSQPFKLGCHETFTTASIGIALSTLGYERADDVLRDADAAMYRAKALGNSHYQVFDRDMHAYARNLLHLEADLRRAIRSQELVLYYQPIVSLAAGKLIGFEALVRWRHPQRGLIPPLDFIPMAEETGLIFTIGEWVLDEACHQMRRWQEQFPSHQSLSMSVNLSSKQFTQPGLIDQVIRTLQKTGLRPQSLMLEITESAVMEDISTATGMLQQLRALGVKLSIDDFGTGYSSLSYLHRLPIDTLKIDRSFVCRMVQNDENTDIIRTIVTLARSLGLGVVAEGVETMEQLAQLRLLECNNGQGYLFSKPINAEAAGALILKKPQWQPCIAMEETRQQDVEPSLPQYSASSNSARPVLLQRAS